MMSINSRIVDAVTPIVPVCVPAGYDGAAEIYTTFNINSIPMGFGDGKPRCLRCMVQLHAFFPEGYSSLKTRRSLARAILAAGFTYPTEEDASDDVGQHYVLEFEGIGEA